jgi:hypothetical protein
MEDNVTHMNCTCKESLTYCSFATDEDGCRGVCILEGALSPIEAANKAWSLGINPGGELVAVACNKGDTDVPPNLFAIMKSNTNRLIPAEEARELFEAKSIREFQEEDDSPTAR